MTEPLSKSIFSDEIVKAADLDREPAAILSKATQRPITIVREDECFTLMRREDIYNIINEATHTKRALELLGAAYLLINSGTNYVSDAYSWLKAFDKEEIQTLITEVSEAYRNVVTDTNDWESLEAIVHEWHESAVAILSKDLSQAWRATAAEVPLTSPVEYSAS